MTRHTFIEKNTPQNQVFVAIAIEYIERILKSIRNYVTDLENNPSLTELILDRVLFYRELLEDGYNFLKTKTIGYEYFSNSLKKLYEQDVQGVLARIDALDPTNPAN